MELAEKGVDLSPGTTDPAVQNALLFDPKPKLMRLRGLYRWGWAPLIAGCIVLLVAGMFVSEGVLEALGISAATPQARLAYFVRGSLMSVLVAVWAGGYVWMARRKVEEVRDELRSQQAVLAEQSWRAEQMTGLGALSRVLAHEIRSPLHSIALTVALLRKRAQTAEGVKKELILEVADQIEREVSRLDGLLQDYMEYANIPGGGLIAQPVSIREAIGTVVETQRALFERRQVQVSVDVAPEVPIVSADPARIRQLLHLLVRNAVESAQSGGKVTITATTQDDDVQLVVAHDGPKVENPEAVFRPFFSGRRGSSGLALAIVRDVIRAHGGEVFARAAEEGGLEIAIRLPREYA